MSNTKKKRIMILVTAAAVVLVIAGVCLWQFVFRNAGSSGEGDQSAYVTEVSDIMLGGSLGLQSRFSGLIEPQKEIKVRKDTTKKVAKLNVSQGQTVKAGDVLFVYDVDEIALSLEQAKLELEGIGNSINSISNNIEELKKQREEADSDQELSFTVQIQSAELDIKNKEYERTQKNNEIEKLEKSLNNAEVKSEIDGVVKEVNDSAADTEKPYITILSTGNYRVKGIVSELNINALSPGQKVLVKSRIDEGVWKGAIDTVDRENPISDQNNGAVYYSGDSGSTEKASKYNFYVTLENYDNLMLGQHVYVELDNGQEEKKEGIWIPSYYLVEEDGNSYVWARGGGDKLEKRPVTVGEYDEAMDLKQITEGLAATDFITFPSGDLTEGMPTTTEMPTDGMMNGGSVGGEADMLSQGGEMDGGAAGEAGAGDESAAEEGDGGTEDGGDMEFTPAEDGAAGGGGVIIGGSGAAVAEVR